MNKIAWAVIVFAAVGIQDKKKLGYDDTPMLPGGKWHVHDGERPQPALVTAGVDSAPPSDAIVLFDGKDLSKWRDGKGKEARWKVEDGIMEVVPRTGDIWSKDEFGDCQIHVEWRSPTPAKGDGQGRGNSGVFLMGKYEIQVLDSFDNPTYPDGQAAAIYGQTPPLVNASRKPGEWQTYDIILGAPRFKEGEVVSRGFVTVLHNGVVVHHHAEIMGNTVHRALPKYVPDNGKGPLRLQDHGDLVRFRNIWVRPLKGYDEK